MPESQKIVAAAEGVPSQQRRHLRLLASSGYCVGFLLIAIPTVELAARAFPFEISSLTWRFVAGGLISNAALLVVVGLAVLMFTAANLGHRRTLRALSVALFIASLTTIAVMAMFMMDGLDMRRTIDPEGHLAYDIAVAKTQLILALALASGVWMAIASWRVSARLVRGGTRRARVKSREATKDSHKTKKNKENTSSVASEIPSTANLGLGRGSA